MVEGVGGGLALALNKYLNLAHVIIFSEPRRVKVITKVCPVRRIAPPPVTGTYFVVVWLASDQQSDKISLSFIKVEMSFKFTA